MKKLLLRVLFGAMAGALLNVHADSLDTLAQAFDSLRVPKIVTDRRAELMLKESLPMKVVLNGGDLDAILKAYDQQVKELAQYNDLITPYSDAIRVVTYNVHYWADPHHKSNIDDVFKVLKTIDADVVCLQEVSWGKTKYNQYTAQEIVKQMQKLGYGYGGNNTLWSAGDLFGAPFGNMIFSKHKVRDIVIHSYKDGYRGFVGVTIDIRGKPLRIYCTHFEVKGGQTREAEATEFVEHIQKNDKNVKDVLLVGDFNEARKKDYKKEVWDDYVQFMKNKYKATQRDAVSKVLHGAGFKDAYELKGYRPPFTVWTGSIIDFGYFSVGAGAWWVKDVNVYFDAASDHLPVVFDLVLK